MPWVVSCAPRLLGGWETSSEDGSHYEKDGECSGHRVVFLSKITNEQSDRTCMSALQMLKSVLYYITLHIFIVCVFGGFFFLTYSEKACH